MITINLLSSFRLTYGSQPVPLQYRQVLLVQALWCAGGPVTADGLMHGLWEQPGPGSRETLRVHVSRTRRALTAAGADFKRFIITTKFGGGQTAYQLTRQVQVDAEQFRRLAADGSLAVRDGDHERGAELLTEALSLWDGGTGHHPWAGRRGEDLRPLPEAARQEFASDVRKKLLDRRNSAMLDLLTALISLGRHREAVTDLEQIAREDPREGTALRLLVIALYRSERFADASRTCRRAIRTLQAAGEHDGHLQHLQQAILTRTFPFRGPIAS
jgi:DNA-binding SARP family transcriptional activator